MEGRHPPVQTLQASSSLASTTEPFSKWTSYGAGTANGNKIDVPGSNAIAIAIYEKPDGGGPVGKPGVGGEIFGTIIGGI